MKKMKKVKIKRIKTKPQKPSIVESWIHYNDDGDVIGARITSNGINSWADYDHNGNPYNVNYSKDCYSSDDLKEYKDKTIWKNFDNGFELYFYRCKHGHITYQNANRAAFEVSIKYDKCGNLIYFKFIIE